MEIYKRADRILKTSAVLSSVRSTGAETKFIGEFTKWKELQNDSRISVSYKVYGIKYPKKEIAYILSDTLGFLACTATTNKEEVFEWLKAHNYKTTKDFYIQDYGMSEETWNEWNKGYEE